MRATKSADSLIESESIHSIRHSKPWIHPEDSDLVVETLRSGNLGRGQLTELLTEKLSEYLGASHVEFYGTGRDALVAALEILSVGPGDEVIIPTYVCVDVKDAVRQIGAIPRIADVSMSGVLYPESVQRAMSSKTRAVVAVHIFGHHCDIESLKQFGLPVIEDACQAFGVRFSRERNQIAGSLGDVSFFSFHPTKLLTGGSGGALVTMDELKNGVGKPSNPAFGDAAKGGFSDLNASLLIRQLERFSEFIHRRKSIQEEYDSVIHESLLPRGRGGSDFLFRYTLRTERGFDETEGFFRKKKIEARRGVDRLLHRELGLNLSGFPNAEKIFRTNVSIPFYPALNDVEVARVKSALEELSSDV